MPEFDQQLVKKYGKIFGCFDGCQPNLWVTDADVIKQVFVKEFEHFTDPRVTFYKLC